MARNKLSDLNDHLFNALEDLTNPETNDKGEPVEDMEKTIKRATAMAKVGAVIVNNAKIHLQAAQLVASGRMELSELPENIKVNNHKQLK